MQCIFITNFSQIISCIFLRWGESKYLIYKFIEIYCKPVKGKLLLWKEAVWENIEEGEKVWKDMKDQLPISKYGWRKDILVVARGPRVDFHNLFLIFTMWSLQWLCLSLSFITSWHSFLTCIFCHSFNSSFSCSAAQEMIHFQSSPPMTKGLFFFPALWDVCSDWRWHLKR